MKNLFLKFSLLLFSVGALAQQEINTTFASQMATLISPLNKAKVPNGILLDIAMELKISNQKNKILKSNRSP
jgi:hypothetical protein